MARMRYNHSSFTTGYISEKIRGNTDLEPYNNALSICDNAQVQHTGGIFKRAGTKFQDRTANDQYARLIPFVYSTSKSYVLEFTAGEEEGKIRAYNMSGLIDGVELESPFLTKELLDDIKYYQSGLTLYLVSGLGIYELVLVNGIDHVFTLTKKTFTIPPLSFNNTEDIALLPSSVDGDITLLVVKSTDSGSKPPVSFAPFFYDDDVGGYIRLTYITNEGYTANYYLKIREVLVDEGGFNKVVCNIDQDYSFRSEDGTYKLPTLNGNKLFRIPICGTDNRGHAKASTFFEGRMFLANVPSRPVGIWGSSLFFDDYYNFGTGDSAAAGVQINTAIDKSDEILWIEGQSKLFVGTRGGVYLAGAATYHEEAITPDNFRVKLFDSVGANKIQPVKAMDTIFFVDTAGINVHEIILSQETLSYQANDLSLIANDYTQSGIIAHAWQQSPTKTYWCAVNDGHLCSLTYLKNNNILAWSKHLLGGMGVFVESITTIPGEDGDYVWLSVRREVDGRIVRSVEYLEHIYNPMKDADYEHYYVDAGRNYENVRNIEGVSRSEQAHVTVDMEGEIVVGDLRDIDCLIDIPEKRMNEVGEFELISYTSQTDGLIALVYGHEDDEYAVVFNGEGWTLPSGFVPTRAGFQCIAPHITSDIFIGGEEGAVCKVSVDTGESTLIPVPREAGAPVNACGFSGEVADKRYFCGRHGAWEIRESLGGSYLQFVGGLSIEDSLEQINNVQYCKAIPRATTDGVEVLIIGQYNFMQVFNPTRNSWGGAINLGGGNTDYLTHFAEVDSGVSEEFKHSFVGGTNGVLYWNYLGAWESAEEWKVYQEFDGEIIGIFTKDFVDERAYLGTDITDKELGYLDYGYLIVAVKKAGETVIYYMPCKDLLISGNRFEILDQFDIESTLCLPTIKVEGPEYRGMKYDDISYMLENRVEFFNFKFKNVLKFKATNVTKHGFDLMAEVGSQSVPVPLEMMPRIDYTTPLYIKRFAVTNSIIRVIDGGQYIELYGEPGISSRVNSRVRVIGSGITLEHYDGTFSKLEKINCVIKTVKPGSIIIGKSVDGVAAPFVSTITIPPPKEGVFVYIKKTDIDVTYTPEDYKSQNIYFAEPTTITLNEGFEEARYHDVRISKVIGLSGINDKEFYMAYSGTANTYKIYNKIQGHLKYTPVDSSRWNIYDAKNGNGVVHKALFEKDDDVIVDNLQHIEGVTNVCAVLNGNTDSEEHTVVDGKINLGKAKTSIYYIVAGIKYKARIETVAFSGGSMLGSSVGAVGSQKDSVIYLYNSLGGKYGTERDKVYSLPYRAKIKFDEPVKLFTGIIKVSLTNSRDVYNRSIYLEHDDPLPFGVLSVVQDVNVSDS